MTSSCTHADRKKVISVAVCLLTRIDEIELWYTCRSRKLCTGRFQSRANWSQETGRKGKGETGLAH